jgi:hypothetical protein
MIAVHTALLTLMMHRKLVTELSALVHIRSVQHLLMWLYCLLLLAHCSAS